MCLYIVDYSPRKLKVRNDGFIHAYKTQRSMNGKLYKVGETYYKKRFISISDQVCSTLYKAGFHAWLYKTHLLNIWGASDLDGAIEIIFTHDDVLCTGVQLDCPVVVLKKFVVLRTLNADLTSRK